MVVDDDPYIRELVSTMLRNENFEVYETSVAVLPSKSWVKKKSICAFSTS